MGAAAARDETRLTQRMLGLSHGKRKFGRRWNPCLPDLIEPVHVARMVLFLACDDPRMCAAGCDMAEAGSI